VIGYNIKGRRSVVRESKHFRDILHIAYGVQQNDNGTVANVIEEKIININI
jgi:hypothetical protein